MNLSALINIFKLQKQLSEKCLSVFGRGAYSIKGMEQAIADGFVSDSLIFGALNTATKNEWLYVHVTLIKGQFNISSDMPHTGIEDIYAKDEKGAMAAVCHVMAQLIAKNNREIK
jgi:hypothetical protein